MKNIKKTMKISMMLVLLLCVLSGCSGGLSGLQPEELPPYPAIDGDLGFAVQGYAKDNAGNPLEGVQMKIDDKLYAITDENGYYKISGLQGNQKIRAQFHDYEFENGEKEFSQDSNFDVSGTNAKKYMITFDSYSSGKSETEIFGVMYEIGGKLYSGDDDSKAFLENLTGKTTITPQKEGFTFSPASMDVYSQTNAKFTATPVAERYSVSGTIDISSFDSEDYIQTVDMYVDGKLATKSYMEYSYSNDGKEIRTMKYNIDGLDKNKTGGYKITYKINGTSSIQTIVATEATTSANFKYYLTKEVDIKLNISLFDDDILELPDGYFLDYDIYVYDEDDTFVKKYSGRDLIEEGVVIWRGAKLEIVGLFKAPDNDGEVSEMKRIERTETISESDMRKDYFDGEYYEVRASLKTYRSDDD